ncbi:hypothetical protein FHT44_003311 [Mycolicibacterium sp. BK634]|uniref:hypothetical protein n=1 Tax=Mycolicibacterium sp. BK634 TaxID=2587099 RepID=UPI00161AB377|nr:hypothetical protein [Mycolicibacterium sp. BK634]MBB3750816.1 hypothetical protein [Mycolicibacterium sp. BK634]
MLTIPENIWLTMLDTFTTFPPSHERVAYLDGVRHRGQQVHHSVATTVTVPDAVTSPGNFTVSALAMEQAGEHFSALGLVRLAQVHTHGGSWIDHSHIDDSHAYSQRDGALSIVLPHHGAGHPWPWQTGVHLREPAGWRRLTGDEINDVLRLVPTVLDYRRSTWSAYPTATPATSAVNSHRSRQPSRPRWLSSLRRSRRH